MADKKRARDFPGSKFSLVTSRGKPLNHLFEILERADLHDVAGRLRSDFHHLTWLKRIRLGSCLGRGFTLNDDFAQTRNRKLTRATLADRLGNLVGKFIQNGRNLFAGEAGGVTVVVALASPDQGEHPTALQASTR